MTLKKYYSIVKHVIVPTDLTDCIIIFVSIVLIILTNLII
jgi:hypothetical protein